MEHVGSLCSSVEVAVTCWMHNWKCACILGSQQEEKSIHFVCFPCWCVLFVLYNEVREKYRKWWFLESLFNGFMRDLEKYHKWTPKLLASADMEVWSLIQIQLRIKLAARKYTNSVIPDTKTFWASVTELAFTGSVYFYGITGYLKELNSLVSVPLKYICISCTAF